MIQINVTAKCEDLTQRGTKCTKEAKVYEPGHSIDAIDEDGIPTVRITKEGGRHSSYDSIPMGFRCNTHSRAGRAEAARRWTANHFSRTNPRMSGINTI
jgi:hypothetical protein